MLQWLLDIWLLLIASLTATHQQSDQAAHGTYCWNSQTRDFDDCLGCLIANKRITDNTVSIAFINRNGTDIYIGFVRFEGGDFTTLPQVVHKRTNSHILNVELREKKTQLLSAQFFGDAAQYLSFISNYNDNLTVEA